MKKNPISTRRIFPSSQVPPSSVISYGVFLLVFIILISFMLFRTSSQQENLINMNSRLIDLEQQVQQSVQSSEVTVETLSDDLKEVNREIRKLWDLSNKRNKQRIAFLEDQLNSISSSIKEIFTQSQEIRLISKEFSKSLSITLGKRFLLEIKPNEYEGEIYLDNTKVKVQKNVWNKSQCII